MSGNCSVTFGKGVFVARDTLGSFEFQLLSVLLDQPRDAYGITIMDRIADRTGRKPNLGSVYKGLDRLETKGFVTSWWGEPTDERGGRRKRYYRIEASGVEILRHSRAVFASFDPVTAGA